MRKGFLSKTVISLIITSMIATSMPVNTYATNIDTSDIGVNTVSGNSSTDDEVIIPDGAIKAISKRKLSSYVTEAREGTGPCELLKDGEVSTLYLSEKLVDNKYLGYSFKFHTTNNDSFYKINLKNYSLDSNINIIVYDKDGIIINPLNNKYENSETSIGESKIICPIIKLHKNEDYFITAYVENKENGLGWRTNGFTDGQIYLSYQELVDKTSDTYGNANNLKLNLECTNTLDGFADVDWYKITTPSSQSFFNVKFLNKSIEKETKFKLYDEKLESILSANLTSSLAYDKTVKLNSNSTYYICVENNDKRYEANEHQYYGDYSIFINVKSDDYEDTMQTSKQIKILDTVKGEIQSKDDIDVFNFKSGTLSSYYIRINNYNNIAALKFYVKDVVGKELAKAEVKPGTELVTKLDSEKLEKNNDYYIVVEGEEGIAYSVRIESVSHKIIYKLNGGTNNKDNPSVFFETFDVNIKNPTRKGYNFVGWIKTGGGNNNNKMTNYFSDDKEKVEYAKSVGANDKDDVTLEAKWEKIKVAKNSIKKLKSTKNSVTVTINKVSGSAGYEIQYSTSKNMKKAKIVKLSKSKSKATIKKLKKGKKYYVRTRAYKKDPTGNKVYAKWSSVKSIVTKKK